MAFTPSRGRTQTSLAEINVTPFVDVVLVLLIIFMVTAPVIESGIEVDVPATKVVANQTDERVTVTIDKKEKLYVGLQAVNIHDLGDQVHKAMHDRSQKEVYLRCDKNVSFGVYASVIGELKISGIDKINAVTRPYEASPK